MSATATRHVLPLALLVLVGCGDKKDWDEEIIIQVFKPVGAELGPVMVIASQGGKSAKTEVEGFGSCKENRVRLIPKQGSTEKLTVRVSVGLAAGPDLLCPPGIASCGQDCCELTPPVSSPLNLVLGAGSALEPAGPCTPSIQPDGGPPKRATGQACTQDGECKGGKCLKTADSGQTTLVFQDGYCTADCTADPGVCGTGESCWTSENALGTVVGKYCVLTCKTGDGTCTRPGYTCSPGDLCMPQ